MSQSAEPQSHVIPAFRLAGSLAAGLIIAAFGGMVLGEYTFQGEGIQWLAISGGVGLGAAIAWVLNRIWSHDPPLWMAGVAAALSLAGIGPDRTTIDIWADPAVTRNCHTIEVESDSALFSMTIENIPSENPKTGRITAISALAALRKMHAPHRVGT